jgi:hypothetical protein
MKPSRPSPHRRPSTVQLSLPWPTARIAGLDTAGRAGVIALLARLLIEATPPAPVPEDAHDAS